MEFASSRPITRLRQQDPSIRGRAQTKLDQPCRKPGHHNLNTVREVSSLILLRNPPRVYTSRPRVRTEQVYGLPCVIVVARCDHKIHEYSKMWLSGCAVKKKTTSSRITMKNTAATSCYLFSKQEKWKEKCNASKEENMLRWHKVCCVKTEVAKRSKSRVGLGPLAGACRTGTITTQSRYTLA